MPRCRICNKYINTYSPEQLCRICARYLKNNALFDKDYTIGKQKTLKNGKKVCKICGKAFYNLANHIQQGHNFSVEDYMKEFELNYDRHICDNKREKEPNKMSEEGIAVLQSNMGIARATYQEKCREIKKNGGKVTRKSSPKKNLSEKDRERRRLAMILINQKRKNEKNS